jgi:hypothetical protein
MNQTRDRADGLRGALPLNPVLGTPIGMDQVRAAGAFVSSFFKDTWSLRDYPVRIRHRPGGQIGRLKPFEWTAHVINWWHMRGDGHSRDEALAALQERFSRFQSANPLPRPGRGAALKVEMAASGVVEANADLVDDILERVLGCVPSDCLVTDESSLWDFHSGESNQEYFGKIAILYGVDVSDINPPTLAAIAARIHRDRRGA